MVFFCDVFQLADQFCNSVGILQQTAQPGNVFSGFEKSKFSLLDIRIALRCRIAENPMKFLIWKNEACGLVKRFFKFVVNGLIDRTMGRTVDYIPSKVKAIFC